MVQTVETLQHGSTESPEDSLTPELAALIDQLVPPASRATRLAGALLVLGALGFLIWPTVSQEMWPPEPALASVNVRYPSTFDEERGRVSVEGSVVPRPNTAAQIVDLTIDAPGADLIELELRSGRDLVTMPFEISMERRDLADATILDYTAWFEPAECESSAEWGVVTVTLQDANGHVSQVATQPYNSVRAIQREYQAMGIDLLQVACEVLR